MVEGLAVPARLTRVALALAVLAVAVPVRGEPRRGRDEFRARFEAGIALYQRGEFEAAVTELAAAHDLDGRPDVTFALAQALRLAGDCERAVFHYRALLEADVSPQRRKAIVEAMSPCAAAMDRRAPVPEESPARRSLEPEPEPGTGPETSGALGVTTTPARDSSPRWYRDPLGSSLVLVGAAGLGLGVTGLLLSESRYASADGAATEKAFADAIASGERWRSIGITSLVAGGVLTIGGMVRWIVVAGRDDDEGRVAVVPDPRGGLIVAGVF